MIAIDFKKIGLNQEGYLNVFCKKDFICKKENGANLGNTSVKEYFFAQNPPKNRNGMPR